jgi:hypothetical protein
MGGPLRRRRSDPERSVPRSPPTSPASAWTESKVEAVLSALVTFVQNQAQKHGVPAAEVWALIRDELLDPDAGG